MKIRILKDIPGYKAGEKVNENGGVVYHAMFSAKQLIENGFAEEIKEIDIEAIRRQANNWSWNHGLSIEDVAFIGAYRFVKTVIDQFNGDWKPDWEQSIAERKYVPNFDFRSKKWSTASTGYHIESIFPPCKNREDCQKVIELCEPELKVLFGVK